MATLLNIKRCLGNMAILEYQGFINPDKALAMAND